VVTRNRCIGRFKPAIYISGNPSTAGLENNVFALNVIEGSSGIGGAYGFQCNLYSNSNPSTTPNYFINNTINHANGWQAIILSGGGANGPGYWVLQNNIVTNFNSPVFVSAYVSQYTFDHNNYYSTNTWPFTYNTTALTFTQWQNGYGARPPFDAPVGGVDVSFLQDPKLRSSNSALTNLSPTACKTGGTPIDWVALTGEAQLGIDGEAFDPVHPSMGAYAQPVK
jgi:hypothetical protein